MKNIVTLLCCLCLSLALYCATFMFVLKKPLTIGYIQDVYARKFAYSDQIGNKRKVVIFAGSNGLFSHRCEVIEKVTGLPCVNASVAAGIGLRYVLNKVVLITRPGDIVLMPLEYGEYETSDAVINDGISNAYMIEYERDGLSKLDYRQFIHAMFYFDFRFACSAIVEMGLKKSGFSRRFNTNTLTTQGDMKQHSASNSGEYRKFIHDIKNPSYKSATFLEVPSDGARALTEFLEFQKKRQVVVIGTLPTIFDDAPFKMEHIDKLKSLYENAGQKFIYLDNFSRYPRSCFYDTTYHLNEETQIKHSTLIGNKLKTLNLW